MSKSKSLTKLPSLKCGNDKEAAATLQGLIADAQQGLRRIVTAGMYIEWLVTNLKHGQLGPWIETYCPNVTVRTVLNWRTTARNVCDWVGLKSETISEMPISADKLISLPDSDIPESLKPIRKKIDNLLSECKSAKGLQLAFNFGFSQADVDESTGVVTNKRGNRSGKGNPKETREAAKAMKIKADMENAQYESERITKWLLEMADHKHAGSWLTNAQLKDLATACDTFSAYVSRLNASRSTSRINA